MSCYLYEASYKPKIRIREDIFYYVVVTVTTTGYGGIVLNKSGARILFFLGANSYFLLIGFLLNDTSCRWFDFFENTFTTNMTYRTRLICRESTYLVFVTSLLVCGCLEMNKILSMDTGRSIYFSIVL